MTIRTEESGDKLLAGVRAKDVGIVRQALSEGYDPNQADKNGWTAFHEAVSTGNSSIILAFLRRGARPDLQDGVNQESALHIASMDGQTKIVQMLLDNGANISLKNIEGKTAEDVASSACKELLQRKSILHEKDYESQIIS
ncbi:Ankyrin repeat and SOCS box protein 7 [Exaiptasia diaphana]|nr:Ankyrin repeat and SOCS box protein 7 [Exaiptasia diaphana]